MSYFLCGSNTLRNEGRHYIRSQHFTQPPRTKSEIQQASTFYVAIRPNAKHSQSVTRPQDSERPLVNNQDIDPMQIVVSERRVVMLSKCGRNGGSISQMPTTDVEPNASSRTLNPSASTAVHVSGTISFNLSLEQINAW